MTQETTVADEQGLGLKNALRGFCVHRDGDVAVYRAGDHMTVVRAADHQKTNRTSVAVRYDLNGFPDAHTGTPDGKPNPHEWKLFGAIARCVGDLYVRHRIPEPTRHMATPMGPPHQRHWR